MAWVKIDDQFFMHPKVIGAGRDARDFYLAALTYSAGQLTDGYVPAGALALIAAMAGVLDADAQAARLMQVRLWEPTDGGYRIHEYLGCAVAPDPTTQEQRKTREYEAWRRAVLERDGFACTACGATCCELHVHHRKSWAHHPALRFDVANGITLCRRCHREMHAKARKRRAGRTP